MIVALIAQDVLRRIFDLLALLGLVLGSVFVEPERAPVSQEIWRVFAALRLPPERGPRWWLQKLMIDPARQGERLGHELLAGVRRHVAAQGGGTVLLDCWAGNAKLRAFYLEDGFELHGEFRAAGYEVAAFPWAATPAAASG